MNIDEQERRGAEEQKPSLRPAGTKAIAPAVSVGAVGNRRFVRYFMIVVSAFGALYALQTVSQFEVASKSLGGPFALPTVVLMWLSAFAGTAAAIVHMHIRPILWASVAAFALGVALLPFAIARPIPADQMPWFVTVSAVPLLYLAVVSRSTLLSIGLGLVLAGVLTWVLGNVGGIQPAAAIVDEIFMVTLCVVFTLVVAALRNGVRRSARSQTKVLAEYAASQAEAATEAERRRTDALLHDAVLTTFLTAASAQTPEAEELAGRMAANAVRVLAHVNRSAEYGVVVPFSDAWAAARVRLAPLISRFSIDDNASREVVLPLDVADTMLAAMAEAMTNSVHHSAARHHEVRLAPLGPDGLRIVVRDDGVGFDLASVALRGVADVVQRPLRRFDGRADIDTSPGHGCTVTLSWGSVVISGTDPLQDERLATA